MEATIDNMEAVEEERVRNLLADTIKWTTDNATDISKNTLELEITQALFFIHKRARHLQDPEFTFKKIFTDPDTSAEELQEHANSRASIFQMTIDEQLVGLKHKVDKALEDAGDYSQRWVVHKLSEFDDHVQNDIAAVEAGLNAESARYYKNVVVQSKAFARGSASKVTNTAEQNIMDIMIDSKSKVGAEIGDIQAQMQSLISDAQSGLTKADRAYSQEVSSEKLRLVQYLIDKTNQIRGNITEAEAQLDGKVDEQYTTLDEALNLAKLNMGQKMKGVVEQITQSFEQHPNVTFTFDPTQYYMFWDE